MTKNGNTSDMTVGSAITARSVSSTGFDPYSGEQHIYEWNEQD